jgi:very-short-patch-repair endonuclease
VSHPKKHYPHYLIELARGFRKNSTPAEDILWERLKNRKLAGLKFRRQEHIGRFIVDFYCHELMLVVELEGGIHDCADQKEYDQARFEELDARGFRILRIKNSEVIENIDKVLEKILMFR